MLRDQGYIRVKEAAEILGVCLNTIRAWGAAGRIPEYRHPVNQYRLYKREELDLKQANALAEIGGSSC